MPVPPPDPAAQSPPSGTRRGRSPEAAAGPAPDDVIAALELPVDERMYRYVDMLATTGVARGLIGPREADRLWERHILNCALLEQLIPHGAAVADVGSGAGLPGIVLALVRGDLHVTLLEPLLRRATFLTEAVGELGLESTVEVTRARAEDYTGPPYTVVTARAVAPLDRLAAVALPLLTTGGKLLAIKGRRADDEVREHRAAMSELGARRVDVVRLGAGVLTEPTTVVVVYAG